MLRGTKVRVEAGDMKKKVTLLLVVLLVLGWYQTVNTVFAIPVRYAAHITAAEKYARKEIFEDALTEYQEALKLQPKSVRVKRSIAEMQLKLGNRPEFIRGCEALIGREELDEEALRMLAAYYDSNGKEEEIVLLLRELRGTHSGSEAVNELWDRYRGSYEELYYSYEEIKPFHDGYAVVKTEGKYGLIDMEGKGVIRQIYDAAGAFSQEAGCAPVSEGGNWYYLNEKQHKKLVPDEDYDYLGTVSGGIAAAGSGGKFGFADTQLILKTECGWEEVSNPYQGIAAAKRDGKWALLDDSLQPVTDYIYEDIAMDENGFCSGHGLVFAKKEDGYHLVDGGGGEVCARVFENARPFGSSELTAVCMDGKWGFVDTKGEMVLSCRYEDAGPFQMGVAPVKQSGKWGYIDPEGNFLIDPVFEDAYPFCEGGTAPVKQDDWFLIRLYAIS